MLCGTLLDYVFPQADHKGAITEDETAAVYREQAGNSPSIQDLAFYTREIINSYSYRLDQHQKKRLICKIPDKFLEVDEQAYVPCRWSIGPYHYGDKHVEFTEKNKPYCLREHSSQLEDYYKKLMPLEEKARSYYSEDIPLGSRDFLQMLLFDSFVLLSTIPEIPQHPTDSLPESSSTGTNQHGKSTALADLMHDLLLLENQIPYFVLQLVHDVAHGANTCADVLALRVQKFLKENFKNIIPIPASYKRPKEIHHLLHLFHSFFKPTGKSPQTESNLLTEKFEKCCWSRSGTNYVPEHLRRWRRASEYHAAGVLFQKIEHNQSSTHSLLDVEFNNGVLSVPKLIIDGKANYIFRNLMAFEQETAADVGNNIRAYIIFMSQLLSMPEDVTLLSQKGIIVHQLGCDEQVSLLFKNLVKNVVFDFSSNYYLKSICGALEKHYRKPWNHWLAWLWHNRLKNPWLILGLFAGIVTLVCVIVQSIYQVLSYYNQIVQSTSNSRKA